MFEMKTTLLCLVIAAYVSDASLEKHTKYRCHMNEFYFCLRKAAAGYLTKGVPTAASGIASKCKRSEDNRRCFWDYTQRCAPGSIGEFLYGIFGGYKDGYDQFCPPHTALHQSYARIASCANKVFLSDEFTKVLKFVPNSWQSLIWNPENFVAKVICYFGEFMYHYNKEMAEECNGDSDYINHKILYSFSNFPFVFYEQYVTNGTSSCLDLVPKLGDPFPDSEDTDDFLYLADKLMDMRNKFYE